MGSARLALPLGLCDTCECYSVKRLNDNLPTVFQRCNLDFLLFVLFFFKQVKTLRLR